MFKGVICKNGVCDLFYVNATINEKVASIANGFLDRIPNLKEKYGVDFIEQLNAYAEHVNITLAKAKVQNLGITFCADCNKALVNDMDIYLSVQNRGSIPLCKECAKAEKEKTYKMYLKNDLIPDVKFEIAENTIKVSSPSTIFVQIFREPEYVQKDCLGIYSQILRLAKEKGVKISYKNGTKKKLLSLWSDYKADTSELNFIYSSIIEVLKKVQTNGIHYGAVDDLLLNKAEDLAHTFNKRKLESSISKIGPIVSFWGNILVDLKHFDPATGSLTICL